MIGFGIFSDNHRAVRTPESIATQAITIVLKMYIDYVTMDVLFFSCYLYWEYDLHFNVFVYYNHLYRWIVWASLPTIK